MGYLEVVVCRSFDGIGLLKRGCHRRAVAKSDDPFMFWDLLVSNEAKALHPSRRKGRNGTNHLLRNFFRCLRLFFVVIVAL